MGLALPAMVWLALGGGVLLLVAAVLPRWRGIPAGPRLQWHRRVAAAGLLLVAIHAVMGLSRFW